jgi:hypothetical protein
MESIKTTEQSDPEPIPPTEEETETTESGSTTPNSQAPTLVGKIPSHDPLVFQNYPPLWSKDTKSNPEPRPRIAKETQSEPNLNAGMPVSTLKAVLSTTSSREEKRPNKQFNELDPTNRHQYLQQPDKAYTHPRLNIFGRDIGPLGKPPPLFRGAGWGIGKRKK